VEAADLVRFARRDWDAIAESKAAYWRELDPGAGILIGDELRRQRLARDPDWPGLEERALDLETHERVARALHLVGESRRR
jgi:hypothetical protein